MIFVIGSTNLDQTGTVPHMPQPGETVMGTTFATAPGGKGANQALGARRAGGSVSFHSAVGGDGFADTALELLRADGVNLRGVSVAQTHTGIALILVDAAGENMIAVLPGANAHVGVGHVEAALAGASAGDTLLLQQEVPIAVNRTALQSGRAAGLRTILNIAPYGPDTPEIARMADILIANETEIAALTGGDDIETAIADLAARNGQIVIVTLGAEGAVFAADGAITRVPAMKVDVVDTVGAGDTFCGYLAAGLDAGLDLEAAVHRGLRAASLACTRHGAQPAIPFSPEVDR